MYNKHAMSLTASCIDIATYSIAIGSYSDWHD